MRRAASRSDSPPCSRRSRTIAPSRLGGAEAMCSVYRTDVNNGARHRYSPTVLERGAVFPPDYDFERSTFRFRAFGDDLASRWHDGGLHRVMRSGLPVRIEAGGPIWYGTPTAADQAELGHLLGMSFDVAGFVQAYPEIAARAAGLPPAADGRPVRDAGHVGDRPAGLAARRLRHPRPVRAAVRAPGRARWFRVVRLSVPGRCSRRRPHRGGAVAGQDPHDHRAVAGRSRPDRRCPTPRSGSG